MNSVETSLYLEENIFELKVLQIKHDAVFAAENLGAQYSIYRCAHPASQPNFSKN